MNPLWPQVYALYLPSTLNPIAPYDHQDGHAPVLLGGEMSLFLRMTFHMGYLQNYGFLVAMDAITESNT